MKITSFELFKVAPRWLFLKTVTDEGICGWGEPVIEGRAETVAAADQALSTGGMLRFVKGSEAKEFIVGTEYGILHRMEKENPGKKFHPLDPRPCCADMKLVTLEKIRDALRDGKPEVDLTVELMDRARTAIERMLAIR